MGNLSVKSRPVFKVKVTEFWSIAPLADLIFETVTVKLLKLESATVGFITKMVLLFSKLVLKEIPAPPLSLNRILLGKLAGFTASLNVIFTSVLADTSAKFKLAFVFPSTETEVKAKLLRGGVIGSFDFLQAPVKNIIINKFYQEFYWNFLNFFVDIENCKSFVGT